MLYRSEILEKVSQKFVIQTWDMCGDPKGLGRSTLQKFRLKIFLGRNGKRGQNRGCPNWHVGQPPKIPQSCLDLAGQIGRYFLLTSTMSV